MKSKAIILSLLILFTVQLIFANNPYEAIDPSTLPIYPGSMNAPGIKIVFEDENGLYILLESEGVLYVVYI